MIVSAAYQYAYSNVGELFVRWNGNPGSSISLSIVSQDYAWTWSNNAVALMTNNYNNTYYSLPRQFAAPTSNDQEPDGVMPWGLMQFNIIVNGSTGWSLTFQIDFRDQAWSGNYGNGDFNLYVDNSQEKIFLQNSGYTNLYISSGQKVPIWYNYPGDYQPTQNNFTIPLTVKNVIGSSNAGGNLHVDGVQYSSGSSPPVGYLSSHSVTTDNERFTNYPGGGTYKHNQWNSVVGDYLLTHTYTPIHGTNEDDAIFRPLSAATIQATLTDNGSNLDNIQFRDPWYVESDGTQPNNFDTFTSPFHPTGSYGQSSGGVFLSQPIESGKPYYSVQTPSTKNVSGYGATFTGWTVSPSNYATLQNAASTSTPVIFNSASATITANYKGSLASNTSSAMSLPCERKIARSVEGNYYITYESQGSIWVEYSTDGTNWQLANGNQPLGTGTTPAITPFNDAGGEVMVVFNNHTGTSSLYGVSTTGVHNYGSVYDVSGEITTPVVGITDIYTSDFLVLWKGAGGGIRYSIGRLVNDTYISWLFQNATLTGTDANSYTPTVECMSNIFQIAWEERIPGSSSSNIDYTNLTRRSDGGYTQGSVTVMSAFPHNYNPSLIACSDGSARVCWMSEYPGFIPPETIFHAPDYYVYWYFGNGVSSASINQAPGIVYIVGWVNSDGTQQYTNSAHLSNPQPLASTGSYVQIANGVSTTTVRSLGFNTGGSPYRFNLSSGIPYYKTGDNYIGRGRGGIVTTKDAKFMFLFGDVVAGGVKIDFVEMPDTVKFDGAASLNSYLETQPFKLHDGTSLSYAVEYMTMDSTAAVSALSSGKNVSFKVELVDVQTGKVIGAFDNPVYSSTNIVSYKNVGYDVDTKGIGDRNVKMRLTVGTSLEAQFAAVNRAATSLALAKEGVNLQTINFTGSLAVTDYALDQNFPNPFNPTTTISYQLPKASHVTVKVYDMIGREVATLVNEDKEQGHYTASFDASRLSSGIYFYSIRSGNFNAVKKMSLIK